MDGEGQAFTARDMNLMERIRELDAEVLEEESESDEDNERRWTGQTVSNGPERSFMLEASPADIETLRHTESTNMARSEASDGGRQSGQRNAPLEPEPQVEEESPGLDSETATNQDEEDLESSRYDGLYRAYLQRQEWAAEAQTAIEPDSADAFDISQPDSDCPQQAVMTSISEREQQFLASIRQLDQVELEEEEMSEMEDSDDDADSPARSPQEESVPRGGIAFDTSLPALHTYLGEFDDVAGGRAFEEGGAQVSLPIFYLDGVVLFPGDSLPLRVLQPRFQSAVRRAMRQTTHACTIGVVYYRGLFHPQGQGVANVGTTAEIRQVKEQDDGTFNIVAKGRQRFYLRRLTVEPDNSPSAQVEIIPEDKPLRMPHSAFSRLAAWPSLESGRVPSALETRESAPDSPGVYSRSPRRASTGSLSLKGRSSSLDVSPTSAPSRSRRRVSFRGTNRALDVFDFSAEAEASPSKIGQDKLDEKTPDWLQTPATHKARKSHVSTPRSELFLPAYKRRRQRGTVQNAREEESSLPKISWPEFCPARYDVALQLAATRHGLSQDADTSGHLPSSHEFLGPTFADGFAASSSRVLSPGQIGPPSEAWTSAQGLLPGHRRAGLGREQAPGGSDPGSESRENSQGVAKAWASDHAKWRSRAPLSAWPYWVYRMHDAYALSRRVADLMRQVAPARVIDQLLNEPEALSYYVASNLPLQDESRQELLETNGTIYRLRKEIRILEVLDKLRCKACEHLVGSKADLMVMSADGPIGAYVNAHGHIHETLTLRKVQNLELEGAPETENSWFPGYAWTIAHCSSCGYHMGWKFTATKPGMVPDSFWGITRAHLADSMASEDHISAGQLTFRM